MCSKHTNPFYAYFPISFACWSWDKLVTFHFVIAFTLKVEMLFIVTERI